MGKDPGKGIETIRKGGNRGRRPGNYKEGRDRWKDGRSRRG